VNYVQLIFPDFSLILCGFLLCRFTPLNRAVWAPVEQLVYFVFFPVLLFYSIIRTPLDLHAASRLLGAGAALAACAIALAYALPHLPGLRQHIPTRLHAASAQVAFRFNSFIGLAMAERVLGPQGQQLVAVLVGVSVPLANVAAMQGRIAMWHALGEAVSPLNLKVVSSNVFTDPQIASVGVTQAEVDSGIARAHGIKLPLATNARAKMQGVDAGFVKIFCRVSGTVVGAVVVAPNASELIYSLALAVELGLNVDDLATTFTVYPSLSGSIAEAARRLHQVD